MPPLFRSKTFQHRLIAAASLLVYALVSTGLPIPLPRPVVAPGEERFPCEKCGCGCSSATHCWSKCCCHTLSENLAWARREGVRPPEFALAKARAAGLDTMAWDGAAGRPKQIALLAAKTEKQSCCCCTKKLCSTKPEPKKVEHESDRSNTTVAWRALACQGLLNGWLTLGVSISPPIQLTLVVEQDNVEKVLISSDRASSISVPPELPPPQLRTALS